MPVYKEIQKLADVSRYHAKERPEALALMCGARKSTYKQVDNYASQVANALIADGLDAQKRIAYLGKNSDIYFELLLGVAKANAVLVAVNWRLAPPEISYIINDACAEIIFVEEEFLPMIKLVESELGSVRKIIGMGFSVEGVEDFSRWRDNQSTEDPQLNIDIDDVALQMYTSGTTGRPKGVQMSNRGLFALRNAEDQVGDWAKWSNEDVNLVAMPVFHIGGTAWGFTGLYNGAFNIILPIAEPAEMIEVISTYKVNKLFAVPAVLMFILQHPDCTPDKFDSVKYVLYGASPIPLDLLKQSIEMFGAEFVQLYGMTETTGSMTYLPPEEHTVQGSERMKSCGKPFPGIEIKVIDTDGNALPTHKVGEILIKTPSIMKGYWNMDEATEKAVQDGWYYTGDAGYQDEEGYLYIFDRVKDMIVSGGENIYPAEVESALFEHDHIKDVAVIGVPSERWGEAVKAVVVLEQGKQASEDEIIVFVREKIAGYKVPKSVDFVDELPRNPSGKLLKKDLRAPYWEGYERQVN